MLILSVEYLSGWSLSTSVADRDLPEWPPHPDRLFMALVAAHFDGANSDAGRAALQWLESLPAPELLVTPAQVRSPIQTFVPINDKSRGKSLAVSGSMQLPRDRQPRTFPVAVPDDPVVSFVWTAEKPPPDLLDALDRLCRDVTSVGHSASFVRCWITTGSAESQSSAPQTTLHRRYVPVDSVNATMRLRTSGPGRLLELERRCNRESVNTFFELTFRSKELARQIKTTKGTTKKALQQELDSVDARIADEFSDGEPRVLRPTPMQWQGYHLAQPPKPSEPPVARTHWSSDLLVFRFLPTKTAHLPLTATQQVCETLRNCLMAGSAIQPAPDWLCGHQSDGRPAVRATGHSAIFPLCNVANAHATGHLMGLALALPSDVADSEIQAALQPFLYDDLGAPREFTLKLGVAGVFPVILQSERSPRVSLSPVVWTAAPQGSCRWASVTPIALDRHLKDAQSWDEVTELISQMCVRVGLPNPRVVVPSPVSLVLGALSTREMPRLVRKRDGGKIRQLHAYLEFDEPVVGPVLLGSGRYRGYGLCRPVQEIN
jgi:CRISPR-associated protein Csb2